MSGLTIISGRVGALLSLGAAFVLIAGCGSGSSTSTSTSDSAAKQAYIAKADVVCAKFNDELNGKINDEFGGKPTTPAKLTKFTTSVTIPLLQRQYAAFRAVPVPDSEKDQVDAILAAVDKALAASRKDPGALFQTSGTGQGAFAEANQLEASFGFKECGGGSD